jgi:hypothetical protein
MGFSYQSAHETEYKYGMIVENLQLGDLETQHGRRSIRGELSDGVWILRSESTVSFGLGSHLISIPICSIRSHMPLSRLPA